MPDFSNTSTSDSMHQDGVASPPSAELITDAVVREAMERTHTEDQERRARIFAAAADGTGVQPWERDWPYLEFVVFEHFGYEFPADAILIGQLLTMLSWALASPQGRAALHRDGQPSNPGQHTLDTLRDMRSGLVCRQRELLEQQHVGEPSEWVAKLPLGDFNLHEHITTSPLFCADWFSLGEMLEIIDWALASPKLLPLNDPEAPRSALQQTILELCADLAEALRVRRRKLLLAEARSCLSHAHEVLAELEERLGS